ncbi:succinate dehydrogenase assembly factor 4, mitochondrial [Ricinus communis]|uniref:succinate dehydrogenase assembly factor 4, mitochondrial n=1 Tax=Ricinus communis TaxID=3988 RepID=UPI00201A590B|nr:succinate dehydrogenase assembly factor 4, mitochondrial [Ricinus communis]
MARNNLGRLLSSSASLSNLSTRSESVIRSSSRMISSSSTSQPQSQDTQNNKEGEEENKKKPEIGSKEDQEYDDEFVNKETGEIGGPKGPEPTRYGDWERNGRCSDF